MKCRVKQLCNQHNCFFYGAILRFNSLGKQFTSKAKQAITAIYNQQKSPALLRTGLFYFTCFLAYY